MIAPDHDRTTNGLHCPPSVRDSVFSCNCSWGGSLYLKATLVLVLTLINARGHWCWVCHSVLVVCPLP